jgi:hypothetical protein
MSSSASTVLTFPLTLREYFWVIARASSICATAVFIGAGHVPVQVPSRCIRWHGDYSQIRGMGTRFGARNFGDES